MSYHDTAIRAVVERLNLVPLKQIAQQASMQSAHRVIVYYADGRAYHSAATLIYEPRLAQAQLETAYLGFFDNQPIKRSVTLEQYYKFRTILHSIKFDTLYFPSSNLLHTPTLWCIERATGNFNHQVIINPHHIQQPFCTLTNAIDGFLSEAVREIAQ